MLEGLFTSLSPSQRQLVTYGLPLAGLAAVVVVRRGATKAAPKPTVTIPAQANGNDAAISAGQLAGFESAWSDALGSGLDDIWSAINAWNQPAAASTTPTTATNPQLASSAPASSSTASPAAPTPSQLAYGNGFVNSFEGTGQQWAPTPAPTSVQAPAGGTLMYGTWTNGVLTGGTYRLADGSVVTK